MRWISTRRRLADHSGFTLIEASVAMLLVAMMFTALSAGLMGGLRATRDARLFQQATSIGEEAVERARDLQFDTLVMQSADIAGDPRIAAGPRFDPDDAGPLVSEPVVVSTSGGAVVPHITTETFGGTTFTTSRYVTWVDDITQGGPAQSYKRMVVIIEWEIGGKQNSYVTSSFIALARRGLPVPKFVLAPEAQTVQVAQGNLVVLPHTIQNLGIVDTYDLEMTTNPRNWVVNFYKDEGQIGAFEPVVDTLLLDSNSTGTPDTGSVDTDETTYFLAVILLSPAEPLSPPPVNMTLTATSGANDAVTHTATDTVVVGFAGLTLNLHNNPTPPTGNTEAQKPMAMNPAPVSGTALHKYSTNYYNAHGGRFIDKRNAADNEGSTQYMANWLYQIPNANTIFNGTVELKLWVARRDLSCTGGAVNIRAFLRTRTSATPPTSDAGTQIAFGDGVMVPVGIGSCPFQQITITMTMNHTLAQNTWLELKVTNRMASGDAALIAYDTTTYNSTIKLPQVAT